MSRPLRPMPREERERRGDRFCPWGRGGTSGAPRVKPVLERRSYFGASMSNVFSAWRAEHDGACKRIEGDRRGLGGRADHRPATGLVSLESLSALKAVRVRKSSTAPKLAVGCSAQDLRHDCGLSLDQHADYARKLSDNYRGPLRTKVEAKISKRSHDRRSVSW